MRKEKIEEEKVLKAASRDVDADCIGARHAGRNSGYCCREYLHEQEPSGSRCDFGSDY